MLIILFQQLLVEYAYSFSITSGLDSRSVWLKQRVEAADSCDAKHLCLILYYKCQMKPGSLITGANASNKP